MHLFSRPSTGLEAPPAWLVSNGDRTVGPVDTDLLVRGIVSGKIPLDCQVSLCGESWRPVEQVREVRRACLALQGPSEPIPGSVRHSIQWLAHARDVGEALSLALHGACKITNAEVGILYRARAPLELPVVSACFGGPQLELGEVVSRCDPALCAAQEGEPGVVRPSESAVARVMAFRLSPERTPVGLALLPLRTATDVIGVIELGRYDHPFRSSDARSLIPLATAAVARVEELSWEPLGPVPRA